MSKLYTEEQVLRAIMNGYLRGIERHPDYLPIEQSILKDLTPIELPTDEEIGQGCDDNIPLDEKDMWSERFYFRVGAKWYRDKIKGDNK